MITVRFAPVPSGNLHPGGLRVFLINWLFAKKYNGRFILRFEDTDPRISFSEYGDSLFRTLEWLGFKDNFEIMEQGQRHNIYKKAALELVRLGRAYPCFCGGDDLIKRLKDNGFPTEGEMVRYDGHCRNLTAAEIEDRLSAGLKPAYRLKVEPGIIQIDDIIKGPVKFNAELMGDFIILRSNGTGLYNFACVTDDILTGVTHVIRGEDHLVNTPKQLLIYKALEAPPPQFAHIPLFLGNKGEKYSKRTSSLSVFQLKNSGILPDALLNYIFYAGRRKTERRQLLSIDEMVKKFDLSQVSPSYCRFDIEQLKYFNRQAIRQEELWNIEGRINNFLAEKGLVTEKPGARTGEALRRLLPLMQERAHDLGELSLSYYSIRQNMEETGTGPTDNPRADRLKDFILSRRNKLGKAARKAITGSPDGIPLETLLELPPAFLLTKLNNLLHPETGPEEESPPAFTLNKGKMERNRILHYFKTLLGLNPIGIEKLPGLRNASFRVECSEGGFVFKKALTGDFSSLHCEKEVMLHLGAEGLSPCSPFLDLSGEFFDGPVLIYEWKEGKIPERISEDSYKELAEFFCRLNTFIIPSLPLAQTGSLGNYPEELLENFRNYMELRISEGLGEDEFTGRLRDYISIIDEHAAKYGKYWGKELPLSVIHGDLRPSNIVITDNKISAIDWEEARLGDPAFEISWFFSTNNFTASQKRDFLKTYLDLYREKFPKDRFIRERIEGYNLVNLLNFPLGSAIHCMELSQGTKSLSMPIPNFVRMENKALEKSFIEAFAELDAVTNHSLGKSLNVFVNNDENTGAAGMESGFTPPSSFKGRIFLVPPEIPAQSFIVIDGPSSSGKSIIAPEIAGRMDLLYINLGAFFRAVVFELDRRGITPESPLLQEETGKIHIDYIHIKVSPYFRIYINGEDVSPFLYSVRMETQVPLYSGNAFLIGFIKKTIEKITTGARGVIIEGHKAGVEFFPDADYKFFLMLNDSRRVKLKKEQLWEPGEGNEKTVERMLNTRDNLDFRDLPPGWMDSYKIIRMDTLETGKAVGEIFDFISDEFHRELSS